LGVTPVCLASLAAAAAASVVGWGAMAVLKLSQFSLSSVSIFTRATQRVERVFVTATCPSVCPLHTVLYQNGKT